MVVSMSGLEKNISERVQEYSEYLKLPMCTLLFTKSTEQGIHIVGQEGVYTIFYAQSYMLFRALTLLAVSLQKGEKTIDIKQIPSFNELGYMLDASRNAVITVDSSKRLIKYLAGMGYSNYQLYMEDTYELASEPYFGYFRGRYTTEELQEIEREAGKYGMTFIPCIQTLAHLSAYVKWQVHSVQIKRDVDDILLIGSQEVYELIDKMFHALSHLKTRSVNIGMDEAHLVGLGRYLNEHGYQNRSLLMCQHLERVLDIADKYGFKCSMWSDMFFQLLAVSKNYDTDLMIDEQVKYYLNRLKKRVTLVYWDYYQVTEQSYLEKMNRHKDITDESISFAGGAWKWIGYTPDNRFSLKIAQPAYTACQKYGIKNVTLTGWGDNGGECSGFSVLPCLQAWAEYNYTQTLQDFEDNFRTVCGLSSEQFLTLDLANYPPSNTSEQSGVNPNRYVLYQDILCPLLDKHIQHEEDSAYFEKAAKTLNKMTQLNTQWTYLFKTQAALCDVLAIKANISQRIRQAYSQNDRQELSKQKMQLDDLLKKIKRFKTVHSQQWLYENKVFGLDTIDIRLGGLLARVERAIDRISDYLSENIESIEELEVALLPYNDFYKDKSVIATTANQWHLIATASTIYTT